MGTKSPNPADKLVLANLTEIAADAEAARANAVTAAGKVSGMTVLGGIRAQLTSAGAGATTITPQSTSITHVHDAAQSVGFVAPANGRIKVNVDAHRVTGAGYSAQGVGFRITQLHATGSVDKLMSMLDASSINEKQEHGEFYIDGLTAGTTYTLQAVIGNQTAGQLNAAVSIDIVANILVEG